MRTAHKGHAGWDVVSVNVKDGVASIVNRRGPHPLNAAVAIVAQGLEQDAWRGAR